MRRVIERSFNIRAAFFAMTAIFAFDIAQAAAPKNGDRLVEDALCGALRASADQVEIEIPKAHSYLQTVAAKHPSDLSKARIVLSRGITAIELESIASQYGLEVLEIEAKIPVPGSTEVYTVGLMGAALEQVDGGIGTRVQDGIRTTQEEFLQSAAADPASRSKYQSLAKAPVLIYTFESIGKNASLETLAESTQVRLVLRLSTADVEAELKGLRSFRESMQQGRPKLTESNPQ